MNSTSCPNCGKEILYPDAAGGEQVICSCGTSFWLLELDPDQEGTKSDYSEGTTSTLAANANGNRSRIAGLKIKKRWTPLREWLVYFFILSVIIGITVKGYLLKSIELDSTGLTLFIFILFCMALVKSICDISMINREFRLTQQQIEMLWGTAKIRLFLGHAKDSLFRDHVHNLYKIYRQDSDVAQDNLIEILQARLNSRTRIVDLCSGILTTLGLVGTIIGLVMSVNGIQQMTHEIGKNSSAMLAHMGETLSGMGIAFYTTLMGAILGGVFLRVLTACVQSNQDYLVAHIAELSEVYILPPLRKHAKKRSLPDLEEQEE